MSVRAGEVIIKKILSGARMDDGQGNVAVISCGGMYIPHRGQRQIALYEIINTPSHAEPVKVVTGSRPLNALQEVLAKESKN
jgi:hypothetical protein